MNLKVCILCLPILLCNSAFTQSAYYSQPNTAGSLTEPSISINPNNPSEIYLGTNLNHLFKSTDFGTNWTELKLNPPEGFYGDPVVYVALNNHVYFAHLAKNKDKTWPNQFDRIVFENSADGGQTFTSVGIGFNAGKMQDKPWFTVDENKKSPYKNNIYLTWTEFDKYGSFSPTDSSRIRFAYSTNLGLSFSEPVVISDIAGNATDDDSTLEGANIAIGPKGELYCVWAGAGKIWLDISLNGGKTWGKDIAIADQAGGWNHAASIPELNRSNSMPFVVCDNKYVLHVVYAQIVNNNLAVFDLQSTKKAQKWLKPIQISLNTPFKADAYMPHVFKNPKTKCIHVTYHTRRFSNNNLFTHVVARQLKKSTWLGEKTITAAAIPPMGLNTFYGDYISISTSKKLAAIAYTTTPVDEQEPKVEVAMLLLKDIKKAQFNLEPYLVTYINPVSKTMYFNAFLPYSTNAIAELTGFNQIISKSVYTTLPNQILEQAIPINKLTKGMYELKIAAGNTNLVYKFYIEK